MYSGDGPITGYIVDMAKKGSSDFAAVNAEPIGHCYLKVSHKTPNFVTTFVYRNTYVNCEIHIQMFIH